jgi:plasmid stabilization system protein ParE
MKVIWSPLAIQRVREIADYIALDSRRTAARWADALFDKVEILEKNPEIGRTVPELQRPEIRELISGNYRIVYRLSDKQISVLTVRNFKQLLPPGEIGF